ncbi:MAG: polysaccharide deacetylase family protein [Polyangiales bacterium]
MQRLAAISVDLDEIGCYSSIYGLDEPTGDAARAVYLHAIPRYEALFEELNISATFFAIGRDLAVEGNAAIIRRLHERGHEIANHTFGHRYDFSRLSRAQMSHEVRAGSAAIERATGHAPTGFRAPGYTINDVAFEVLTELGVSYDSSVFPCPAYFGAKAAAITSIGLRARLGRGNPSHSIIDTPKMLSAPADPYRVGTPFWSQGAGLLEMPIGVTRLGRLPFIGTSVVLPHPSVADGLARAMIGRPFVNLELHGIDASDGTLDGIGPLSERLPELKRSAEHKLQNLRVVIRRLEAAGYRFVTLDSAAQVA